MLHKKELLLHLNILMDDMRTFFITFLFSFLSAILYAQGNSISYYDWVDKSAKYIDANKLDSAAYSLQQAMRLEPANSNNPMLFLNLGIIQRQLRLTNDAYVSFTAALSNSPEPVLVLHNRASLLCDLNRFDEAMDDYSAIIKIDKGNAEAYYRRGLLYLEANDKVNAENDFAKCEELDENDLFAKLSKALSLKLEDDWEGAEKIYTSIINSDIKKINAYYLNRAECYVNTAKYSLAAADLRTIESSESNNPYLYILRGRVRLNQYDKFAAKADFEKAKNLGYDADLANKWIEKTK